MKINIEVLNSFYHFWLILAFYCVNCLVFDFLNSNEVKLFRSTQEGNILIRLTGINFEPVEGTNRLVYSFSATAVEIGKDTISNCKKYNILKED